MIMNKDGWFLSDDKWIKLIDLQQKYIARGAVFRFRAKYPFEDIVDWMLVDIPGKGFSLICSSGYKAGLFEFLFPEEAEGEEVSGISVKWLIENWEGSIYADCKVEDVYFLVNYFVPTELPEACTADDYYINPEEYYASGED